VTDALMDQLEVPVIGIGAGPSTDGQVLVLHDLLGVYGEQVPRFVRRYADLRGEMIRGLSAYADDVRHRRFPGDEHTYSIDPAELEEFRRYLDQDSLAASAWDW
jgi:3-methyl-2-oxobutanoate hydroxymethyltransferase